MYNAQSRLMQARVVKHDSSRAALRWLCGPRLEFAVQGFTNFTMTQPPIYQQIPAKVPPAIGCATLYTTLSGVCASPNPSKDNIINIGLYTVTVDPPSETQ